jgi:hypothetical protein
LSGSVKRLAESGTEAAHDGSGSNKSLDDGSGAVDCPPNKAEETGPGPISSWSQSLVLIRPRRICYCDRRAESMNSNFLSPFSRFLECFSRTVVPSMAVPHTSWGQRAIYFSISHPQDILTSVIRVLTRRIGFMPSTPQIEVDPSVWR